MHLELMSYELYPEDQYTSAVANIRIDGKYIVAMFQKKTKDGGLFWAPASASVAKGGAKTYIQGFMMDSRFEEKKLTEFVQAATTKGGAMSAQTSNYNATSANSTTSTSIPYGSSPPNFPEGGFVDQNLPF